MEKLIDARGLACPLPVVKAKQEIDGGAAAFTVAVDNYTAVENLQRLADSNGFRTTAESGVNGAYTVAFARAGRLDTESGKTIDTKPQTGDWAVFAGSDGIGSGDAELGRSLMKMYFYTLAQGDDLPASVLFMNGGVKLPSLDDQVVEHLRVLANRGVELLVCGTCLNFYGIAERLQVGTVSNLYDITQRMQRAAKVISL